MPDNFKTLHCPWLGIRVIPYFLGLAAYQSWVHLASHAKSGGVDSNSLNVTSSELEACQEIQLFPNGQTLADIKHDDSEAYCKYSTDLVNLATLNINIQY